MRYRHGRPRFGTHRKWLLTLVAILATAALIGKFIRGGYRGEHVQRQVQPLEQPMR